MIEIRRQNYGLKLAHMQRFLLTARYAVRLKGDVSVLLTSNRDMQRLNRKFRGKDKPTDVLSFPAAEPLVEGFAGDLAISLDIASANARELGHTLEDEVKVLILHGLLHLAGYDHEADDGEMARKESRLRVRLGLPSNLIARSHTRLPMAKKVKPRSSAPTRRVR